MGSAVRSVAPSRSASRSTPVELRLDAAVYSEAALERSRRAFAHLAAIEVRRTGGRWTVRFSNVDPAARDRLSDEFANHVLSCLMVEP